MMALRYFVTILILAGSSSILSAAEPQVVMVSAPEGGHAFMAKTDDKGIVHLVYDTSRGPCYIRYDADQRRYLDEPVVLVDPASRRPGLDFIAWDLAVTGDGTVHVALGNNAWKLKLPQEEWGFFYTRKPSSETQFSPLKNLNRKPSEGFSLAANNQGTVTAVWMADKLYANVSVDGGNTFGKSIELDRELDPCNCCTTSSAYGMDGRLAILYREETNNERDMFLALWDQERNAVTKTRVGSTPWKIDSCPMTYYSVIPHGDGYIAAWPTKGEIYFAKLNLNGSPVEPNEVKTPGVNGMRSGILAVATASGQMFVIWKKDNQLGWQRYDRYCRPAGQPQYAKSDGKGAAAVALKNGDVILFR